MKKVSAIWMLLAMSAIPLTTRPNSLSAAEPDSALKPVGWLTNSSVDVHPHVCGECGEADDSGVECIERTPVSECVTGKKTVFGCQVRYEYVSIPETRYRWKKRWVTKKIPADTCVPVCKAQDGQNCYGAERWDKYGEGCCSKVHCKSVECKQEKSSCKYCDSKPGKTTIKVCYKTCVKEAYTVYRQVKRPICVKRPCHEKVKVPITRYECHRAKCDNDCDQCDGSGCASCTP